MEGPHLIPAPFLVSRTTPLGFRCPGTQQEPPAAPQQSSAQLGMLLAALLKGNQTLWFSPTQSTRL